MAAETNREDGDKDMGICEGCGNEFPFHELDADLCAFCYPEHYPEEFPLDLDGLEADFCYPEHYHEEEADDVPY